MVKIAYCAGHGHNTAGKRSPIGEREWDFNNKVAVAFAKEMSKYKGVSLKRMDDPTGKTDVPLSTRTNGANRWGADIYISFHHNANTAKWGSWTGVQTHVYKTKPADSTRLAKLVQPELVKAYGLRDRGIIYNDLHITRETHCTAILIEGGFMDSTIDIKKLRNDKVLANAGIGVAHAVAKFKNLKLEASKPSKPYKPSTDNLYRVRKSWKDAKSQIGAFANKQSAINLAKSKFGYKVYDGNGKQVYPKVASTPKEIYRVRKSWEDVKSQIGAYTNLQSAKDLSDKNSGYKVYNEAGKAVYKPKGNTMYRVRKSWSDAKSQIGAFTNLENAKESADKNEGYKVFDDNGKNVYTPKPKTISHVVKKGETLWGISQQYGVTVDEIKKLNGLKDDTISIGQKLVIKGSGSPKPKDNTNKETSKKETQKKETLKVTKPKESVDEHKGHNDIMGKFVVSAEKMSAFVKSKNPDAQDIDEIAKAFIEVGSKYGIRGDIAFAQSIIETGWFKFDGGTAVTPNQHNYCGLGVTSLGVKGHSFDTVEDGVTAQIQHLYAYATKDELPKGEKLIDSRFKYVTRGVAPHWEDLNMRWAMNDNYGQHIISIYNEMKEFDYTPPKEESPKKEVPNNWVKFADYLVDRLSNLFKKK